MNSLEQQLAELGLTIKIPWEEVKKAYWKKAKAVHPDRFQGSETQAIRAVRSMQALNEAYEQLKQKVSATGYFHLRDVLRQAPPKQTAPRPERYAYAEPTYRHAESRKQARLAPPLQLIICVTGIFAGLAAGILFANSSALARPISFPRLAPVQPAVSAQPLSATAPKQELLKALLPSVPAQQTAAAGGTVIRPVVRGQEQIKTPTSRPAAASSASGRYLAIDDFDYMISRKKNASL